MTSWRPKHSFSNSLRRPISPRGFLALARPTQPCTILLLKPILQPAALLLCLLPQLTTLRRRPWIANYNLRSPGSRLSLAGAAFLKPLLVVDPCIVSSGTRILPFNHSGFPGPCHFQQALRVSLPPSRSVNFHGHATFADARKVSHIS